MKKLIAIVTFFFFTQFAFSQIFYSEASKNLRYCGEMTNEVLTLLTPDEVQMYNDCVANTGIERDSMVWIQDSVLHQIVKQPNFYTTKAFVSTTENPACRVFTENGYNSLEKPQFMVFLDRYNGRLKITLQMYY